MYPLNQSQPWPLDQWWVAAYAADVGRELLGRTILGQPMILYRTEAGKAVALAGICPHRNFPLIQGKLDGDTVQCPYHGFVFDAEGTCLRVPSQQGIPTRSTLRHFPTVERGGLIWVWTGSAEAADGQLIPALEEMGLGNHLWRADMSPLVTIKGRYTLLIDNLMDLSHASFIHADTIPGAGFIAAIPGEMVETEKSLNAVRVGKAIPSNPLLRKQFPNYHGSADQHFDAEFFSAAFIRTGGAIYPAGKVDPLGVQNFIHCITPETSNSVHYFVITTRNFAIDDEGLSAGNLAMGDRIQPQDTYAIEAIEAILQSLDAPPTETSCRADTIALKVRHHLIRQITKELQKS